MTILNVRLIENEGVETRKWAITLLVATIIVFLLWASSQYFYTPKNPKAKSAPYVPFVAIQKPDWRVLYRTVEAYRTETTTALQKLSRSLQVALDTEDELDLQGNDLLSDMLQRRINQLASIYDMQERLLHHHLLRPFTVTRVLPHHPYQRMIQHPSHNNSHTPNAFTSFSTTKPSLIEHLPYDSAGQVIAHVVRDWTKEGRAVRQSLYHWCRKQLPRNSSGGPVLVPGAGLGRLAYDIAVTGYHVEAVELSLTMAAVAAAILQGHYVQGQHQLHPYALDFFTNEVDSRQRYDSVSFPDIDISQPIDGTLSYTLGDFVEVYKQAKGRYGAVVTCFFLDTATNLYEYLETIHRILKPNGLWINVGPLQWHQNALLSASGDELLGLVHGMGFEVLQWSVDRKPVEYRNAGSTIRSTHYDAYCPLRFVVRKPAT